MSFRAYLYLMGLSTLFAWIGWAIVVMNVNPSESGSVGFVLFYITLTTGLIGVLALAGILYRMMILKRRDVVIREVKTSFRHAILLSAIAVSSLAFSASGQLYWWVLLVLIMSASILEYVALIVQQSRRG